MKHLKIFEEFKVGTLYTAKDEDSNTTQIEIDGYPVKIINREDIPGCKSVYVPILVLKKGITGLEDLCFSELDEVKNHISSMIKGYERLNIDIDSFIVKKMILDLIAPNNKKTVSEDGEQINPTKIYDHIEKYINVLADAYVAITPQRYKATFTKDVIRKGLVRLQQECKFNDLKRTEAAIKVFGDLMAPMMLDVSKTKNIETWKLGSNGKKYGDVFQDFFTMTRLGGISSAG